MRKLALALSLFLMTGMALADTPKDSKDKDAEVQAQTKKPAASAKPKAAAPRVDRTAEIAAQLEALRQSLQSQQAQIQQLKEELAKRDKQISEAHEAAVAASAKATEASGKATEAASASAQVASTASSLNASLVEVKASNETLKAAVADDQKTVKSLDSPSAIRYKGITITPGGFVAAETVYRHRATSADINTPFTGIPYPGSSLANISESNFTGRQTRATVLAESKVGTAKVSGYFEMDFLGAGTTSNNRQSNSYFFRQRQLWAQAAFDNGWSVTAGQMWSLATENRKGIQNRQEALPMQIDPQYVVGFTWQRAYGFRVVKDFGGKFAFGISAEGPQTTIGGRGFSSFTNTSAIGAVTAFQNFWLNAPGAGGGLFNAFDATGYTPNEAPDIVLKAALDPGWGHYEVFAIASTFRNRIYPCSVVGTNAKDSVPPASPTTITCSADPLNTNPKPSALGAFNDSHTGGGFGASVTVPLVPKKVDFGVKAVAGDGIGRFGSAQLPDATARPDGTLALIRTAHALGKLELHPSPKLDIYIYGGSEYAWRAAYAGYTTIGITNTPAIPGCGAANQPACPGGGIQPAYPATVKTAISTSKIGGYGSPFANNSGCSTEGAPTGTSTPNTGPSNCAGDIRNIIEGTVGFWHKFYQGPKGGLRWGVQYSYFEKWGWSGNNISGGAITGTPSTSVSPKAADNMFLTSFRFYLP